MEAKTKTVLVKGGGVAGLSAALDLAKMGVTVHVAEAAPFAGGHARVYACKALDECVQCGACLAEDVLIEASAHPDIVIHTNARVTHGKANGSFAATIEKAPARIKADVCTGCGACLAVCPEPGALEKGTSLAHKPPVKIRPDLCRNVADGSCRKCEEACPEKAVDLDAGPETVEMAADALVLATGFSLFSPKDKPFGYGRFENVVTNFELEAMLRRENKVVRPSDGRVPNHVAFFQCVGSRDGSLNHLWCSRTCCPSSLRMARWIKHRRPETDVLFFYIDIQSFNKDFEDFLQKAGQELTLVRAIPSDVLPAKNGSLTVNWFDKEAKSRTFDLVVLSIGQMPRRDHKETAEASGAGSHRRRVYSTQPAPRRGVCRRRGSGSHEHRRGQGLGRAGRPGRPAPHGSGRMLKNDCAYTCGVKICLKMLIYYM